MVNWWKKLIGSDYKALPSDPDFWKLYLEKINTQPATGTAIEETEFVVFDTETTGLDVENDRVLSIGAVKVFNLEVLVRESFECLVQQEVALGNKSPEVHGILPSEVQQGLTEQEALQAFLNFIGNAVLVGHHVKFDIEMLDQIVRRSKISGRIRNMRLDTATLARRLEKFQFSPDSYNRSDYSLDALCARYKLPAESRHTASGDAFTTAILLLKLLKKAQKRGIKILGDLVK
ncbi:PolC-type DNA polymerase III [Pontibacter locisalis]|uniref:PolC-type DNA polymerase III n=1 Tax=Pontibacter locisalis TaxID=1719035 RepID=A0ABW5IJD2_9BACT